MRLRTLVALWILALIVPSSIAAAQGWDEMDIGSRVSIRVSDSLLPPGLARKNAIVGLVTSRDAQAVHLQITSHDTLRIPRADITRLAVSQGSSRRRSAIRLAFMEAVIFTVLPPPRGDYFGDDHFRGIAIGATVGGILGALLPVEQWKKLRPQQ